LLNLWDIYNRVNYLIGKNQYGKALTPLQYNQLLKWVPQQLIDKYLKDYETTRIVSTNLRHLFKTCGTPEIPKLSVDAFGRVILPDDFYYPSSGYTSTFLNACGSYTEIQNNIEFLDDAAFASRMASQMLAPTEDYPIAKYTTIFSGDDYVQAIIIAPVVSAISFTYIREPETPVLGYTVNAGGTYLYNPNTTVQLDFPDSAKDDLVEMLIQLVARSLHSQEDYQPSVVQENKQGAQ
jgi:hypothetical protein